MTRSEPDNPLPNDTASRGYAGDIDPKQAWDLLSKESDAVLVDVRTSAEWSFVGLADLSSLGKHPVTIEWQSLPAMARNPNFDSDTKGALSQLSTSPDSAVIFICRSGARSREAAISLARLGFKRCYNLAGGFEGDIDTERHRGRRSGWKFHGLPWKQT